MKLRIKAKTANQTFSFEDKRKELESAIAAIQNGKGDSKTLQSLIYDCLTKRTNKGGDALEARKTDPMYQKYGEAWKKWLQGSGAEINGAWAQWNVGGKRSKKDDKTYNFYITVDFSNEDNFKRFWKALPALHSGLKQLAQKIGDGLSFKTSYPLDALLNHNDSVKFYYSNPDVKTEIKNFVTSWASDSGVALGTRAYEHGTDTSGTSFGDLAAKALVEALEKQIALYPNYTPKQWVDWLIVYAPKVLKDSH